MSTYMGTPLLNLLYVPLTQVPQHEQMDGPAAGSEDQGPPIHIIKPEKPRGGIPSTMDAEAKASGAPPARIMSNMVAR